MPREAISREEFALLWNDRTVRVASLCSRFDVTAKTLRQWAKRFGLPPRQLGGYRAPSTPEPLYLSKAEDHCNEVFDGPGLGDPTPEEIRELGAYIQARNLLARQTLEDLTHPPR